MSAKSYYVGDANIIKRLDNIDSIGGPPHTWISIPLPISLLVTPISPLLNDVKTDPNNHDKPFVVGQAYITYKGVAYSSDAGATWNSPSGNYGSITDSVPLFTWYEVCPVDSNVIFICGSNGYVIKSTDGGVNFNLVTQITGTPLTNPPVTSIHFIDQYSGVAGLEGYIARTLDGGTTWVILNSGNQIPLIGQIRGVYLSEDQSVIIAVGENAIARSSNGGLNFSIVYTFPNRSGYHLTFNKATYPINQFWATGLGGIVVTSNDQGITWTTIQAYNPSAGNYIGAHFYNPIQGFYAVTQTGANRVLYTDNTLYSVSDLCSPITKAANAVYTTVIPQVCYKLTNCVTGAFYITNTDLSTYIGTAIRFGITDPSSETAPLAGCWEVQVNDTCNNSVEITIFDEYSTCADCSARCFLLTNCADPSDYILTSTDLEFYLYKVIKLDSCGNRCYFVTRSSLCNEAMPIGPIAATYNDCPTCIGFDTAEPALLNPRRIKPGYYTPACPTELTEKINCNFGEQAYRKMLKVRYGISTCCEEDLEKWTIKKQILDLRSIYDPNLCVSSIVPCKEPCNITAFLTQFIVTIACPSPEDVGAVLDVPPSSCPIPEDDIEVTFGYD